MLKFKVDVHCDYPGCTSGLRWQRHLTPSFIEMVIKDMGWEIGKKVGEKALCPLHRSPIRKSKKENRGG